MNDLNDNPICLVLASLIADDIAELLDASHDFEYAIDRRLHYRQVHEGAFEPEYVQELYDRSNTRLNAVEKKLASIGINVQEAHNRLKGKQAEAAA